MRVCFLLLDCDYQLVQGRPVLRMFGRTLNGESVCVFWEGVKPYFYILPRESQPVIALLNKEFAADVEKIEFTKRYLPIGFARQRASLLKIVLKNPARVPVVRDRLLGLPQVEAVYEADILFKYRFMADQGLAGMCWYRAEGKTVNTDSVNTAIKMTARQIEPVQIDQTPQLKFLSLDIEVVPGSEGMPDARRDPIALISLAFEPQFRGMDSLLLISKRIKVTSSGIRCFEDEADMLRGLADLIREFDPDVLVGYNLDGFDLPYLADRFKAVGILPTLGRCNRKPLLCRRVGGRWMNWITGRVIADVYTLVRESVGKGLLRLKRYGLGDVAKELLGEHKLALSVREIAQYWRGGFADMQKLLDYARRDAQLALSLLLKRRMLDKFIAIAQVSGLLLQDVLSIGEAVRVENLLLREFNRRGFVIPDKPDSTEIRRRAEERRRRGLKGALVLTPAVGLHTKCVVYLDFRSLYPSIFYAYNICPTTLLRAGTEPHITTPFGTRFVTRRVRPGIFSQTVYELVRTRDEVRREVRAESDPDRRRVLNAKQIALKYMANAFYGYTGYLRARFYVLDIANAITSCGRDILTRTRALVEKETGLRVIYGDTDSFKIATTTESVDEAEQIGQQIVNLINSQFKGVIQVKIEGIFKTELILAKKRYAGWLWERVSDGWSDHIIAKGIETVRRDWCDLTGQVLSRVLEIVLKEQNPQGAFNYVRDLLNRLRAGQIPLEQLVITKGLTKSPQDYKGVQPHVELAKKLRRRNPARAPAVGDRIGFVIVQGSQLLSERAEDPEWVRSQGLKIDSRYYIESQILPPLERVFEAMGIDRSRLLGEGRQLLLIDAVNRSHVATSDGFVCDRCAQSYQWPSLTGRCRACGGQLVFSRGGHQSKWVIG